MTERAREQRRFGLAEAKRQIDEPDVPRTTGQIVAVPIRFQHLRIAMPVRVQGLFHPSPRNLPRNVKRAALLNTQERAIAIFAQRMSYRQIQPGCEIGVDSGSDLTVESGGFRARISEADQSTAAPSTVHCCSLHASKIRVVAEIRCMTGRLVFLRMEFVATSPARSTFPASIIARAFSNQ
jgi:hypothetical protein